MCGMTGHDLARELPDISELRDRCRALAMLEAIVGYGSAYPTYVYDARWAPGVELASMRNGGGDEWDVAATVDGLVEAAGQIGYPISAKPDAV
jgi:hypothetical protein